MGIYAHVYNACTCVMCTVGPFRNLNAEKVEEEVGNMWRTMHKLSKAFADNPNPRKLAEGTKSKLDKFKKHIPFLQVFCNPGIKDRHWAKASMYMYMFMYKLYMYIYMYMFVCI